MNTQHSSTAETCSSLSDRVKQAVAKKEYFSLTPERMERIERLDKKYRDWVRKGIIVPQKYTPTPTPEENARTIKIGGF